MKDTISIEVKFPQDMLTTLRKSKQAMGEEIKKMVALELFRGRKLSSGKAAELAGMPLSNFMDLTRKHQVPWVDYTDEELKEEILSAKKFLRKLKVNHR